MFTQKILDTRTHPLTYVGLIKRILIEGVSKNNKSTFEKHYSSNRRSMNWISKKRGYKKQVITFTHILTNYIDILYMHAINKTYT